MGSRSTATATSSSNEVGAGGREAFEVLVVGDGLGARLIAEELVDRGVHAAIVAGDGPRMRAAAESIVVPPFEEDPELLRDSLGEKGKRLWDFADRSIDGLRRTCAARQVDGGWNGVLREAADGAEQRRWAAAAARSVPGVEVLPGGSIQLTRAGWIDVAQLHGRCAQEVPRIRGAVIAVDHGSDGGGFLVRLSDRRTLRTELLVVADAATVPIVAAWLAPALVPVRWTRAVWELGAPPSATGAPPMPRIAGRGSFGALARPDGRWVTLGCRWAVLPEMEAGELDLQNPHPAVLAAQRRMLGERSRGLAAHPFQVDLGIVFWPCDGLPFVGPLPGQPRVAVCLGLGPWGLGWVHGCAQALVSALCGDPSEGPPVELDPRRLI